MISRPLHLGTHVHSTDVDKERLRAYYQSNPFASMTVLDLDQPFYHDEAKHFFPHVRMHERIWALLPREWEDVEPWAQHEAAKAVGIWQQRGRAHGGLVDCISIGNEFILETYGGRVSQKGYQVANACMLRLIQIARGHDHTIIIANSLTSQPWYNLCGPDRNQMGWTGMEECRTSIEASDYLIYHGYHTYKWGTPRMGPDGGLKPESWESVYETYAYFRLPGEKDRREPGSNAGDPGGLYWYPPAKGKLAWWAEYNMEVVNREELIADNPDAGMHSSQYVAKEFVRQLVAHDVRGEVFAVDHFEWQGIGEFASMAMQPYQPLQDAWKGFPREIGEEKPPMPDEPILIGAMLLKANILRTQGHTVMPLANERAAGDGLIVQSVLIDGRPETLVYVDGSGAAVVLADKFPPA